MQMLSVLKTERTRLDSIHSARRSPSEEKKSEKKSLKDQKRKNRRSTPQCLDDIFSEFAFLFRLNVVISQDF